MRVLRLTVSYDGTGFFGWQFQPGKRTIQETLETAVESVTGEQQRSLASGRTDAGVHALGQVVAVRTDTELDATTLCRALNARLPEDIRIRDVGFADPDFHPIRDAKSKRYRYSLQFGGQHDVFRRRLCWHLHRPLDPDAMRDAARLLVGEQDYASFQASGAPRKSTVRNIHHLEIADESVDGQNFVTFEIEANGFLYNMVRIIVGSLVQIGLGKQDEAWLRRVVDGRDRRLAGPTAPPEGLCLLFVRYK